MPSRWMSVVQRIIKYDDSVIVHPIGTLTPHILFCLRTFGISHKPAVPLCHAIGDANGEEAFLRVGKLHSDLCRECCVNIDRPYVRIGVKGHRAMFLED